MWKRFWADPVTRYTVQILAILFALVGIVFTLALIAFYGTFDN